MSLPRLDVNGLLKSHGLVPKKSLGQNFLLDPSALQSVVDAAEIPPQAEVLEIGAGLGSLTRYLARACTRVVAVEIDGDLLPALHAVLQNETRVQVVQGDILKLSPGDLHLRDGYQVVANIPYYITSALIRHLLEAEIKPNRMVLTVQREVAERICAVPDEMSLLALSVQVYGKARVAAMIPAGAFYPAPAVDSSVVRIDLYPQPIIQIEHLEIFFSLARAGFGQKRKTLRNALAAGLGWTTEQSTALLTAAGIDTRRRAETLSMQEWGKLVRIRAAQDS